MSADYERHSPARPLPGSWSVLAGRDTYLAENGFSAAEYDVPFAEYPLLGFRVPIPNSQARRRAIRFHDLHHVATGYGTDKVGEAEVSAWELRRGLRPLGLYVGAIVVSATLLGLLMAPGRTLRAYRASSDAKSLFHGAIPYETLLGMSITELRAALGVPAEGLAREPRKLHALAPATAPDDGRVPTVA